MDSTRRAHGTVHTQEKPYTSTLTARFETGHWCVHDQRPSRYGRCGDRGEEFDADDEEVPQRNRGRVRSHPTRRKSSRRAKFEEVDEMDDDDDDDGDYDYYDYDGHGDDVEPKTPVSRIANRFLQDKIAPGAIYAPRTMKKNFNVRYSASLAKLAATDAGTTESCTRSYPERDARIICASCPSRAGARQ